MNVVCWEGNLHGKIMLIAQAPGENENREGRMFIRPSGKVLDELLSWQKKAIGRKRREENRERYEEHNRFDRKSRGRDGR